MKKTFHSLARNTIEKHFDLMLHRRVGKKFKLVRKFARLHEMCIIFQSVQGELGRLFSDFCAPL